MYLYYIFYPSNKQIPKAQKYNYLYLVWKPVNT